MKELSLNILDIAQNSVKAGAGEVDIILTETADRLTIEIKDDGCGMTPEFLADVANPFRTTRTTRNVGLGIPLFKMAAEQTEGSFSISSRSELEFPDDHGTVVEASFNKNHLDFTPLGDVISTLTVLIQGQPDIRWVFSHVMPDREVRLDTAELKEILGDVPLNNAEVLAWIEEYLKEGYAE